MELASKIIRIGVLVLSEHQFEEEPRLSRLAAGCRRGGPHPKGPPRRIRGPDRVATFAAHCDVVWLSLRVFLDDFATLLEL